jgi:hypothetical protein
VKSKFCTKILDDRSTGISGYGAHAGSTHFAPIDYRFYTKSRNEHASGRNSETRFGFRAMALPTGPAQGDPIEESVVVFPIIPFRLEQNA